MAGEIRPPERQAAWQALRKHQRQLRDAHISELHRKDPRRADAFTIGAGDLLLDYSRQ